MSYQQSQPHTEAPRTQYMAPGPSVPGGPLPGQDFEDDELIPTAIVVKNIPFSVRRETILAILVRVVALMR